MHLVAHQNECQMVTGNIMRIRTPQDAGVFGDVLGTTNEDRSLPRQCTCEPMLAELHEFAHMDGETYYGVPSFFLTK